MITEDLADGIKLEIPSRSFKLQDKSSLQGNVLLNVHSSRLKAVKRMQIEHMRLEENLFSIKILKK